MKTVAFGHRQNVGKSTATRFLISELRIKNRGIHIQQAGFADKVKDVAFQLFSWAGLMPGHHYEENYTLKNIILPKLGKTPRQLWIGVGNGIRQATGYDGTWLDYLVYNTKCDLLVVSDLRFPAEADGLLKAGGLLFRIDRDDAAKVTDGADEPLANYDSWTEIIKNNGSLNDLHKQIMAVIEKYL